MTDSTTRTSPGAIVTDPGAWSDPTRIEGTLAELRRDQPVSWVESPGYTPFWLVTRRADVVAVERDAELFTNQPRVLLQTADQDAARARGPLRSLIDMDGSEHRTHRDVTADWFTPRNLRSIEDAVREDASRTVDELIESGPEVDFAEATLQFPLRVILSLLGLPREDYAWMLQKTQEVFGATDPDLQKERDLAVAYQQTFREVLEYFTKLTVNRQANPTDDLASVIANADIGEAERLSYYGLIATAGHDTTSYSIAGGMLALLQNPDQLALLRDDPELLPQAVEEMLRWTTPVRGFMRNAQRQTELHGVTIQAGDALLLSFLSANRDEAVFDDPQRFDITRTPNRQLAFGFGPHTCLGANLARMEMKLLFAELLSRVDDVELAGDPSWAEAVIVGGVKRLPIRFDTTRSA